MPLGPTFTVNAYYWHFVDVVWIGGVPTIFLVQVTCGGGRPCSPSSARRALAGLLMTAQRAWRRGLAEARRQPSSSTRASSCT